MRLLVVEDDPGMADLLARSLQREGYAVDSATTGEDALWSASENEYDGVVLDAMIPPPDGFEVCRRLRAEGRWVPVLMLTARDAVQDRVRGLDAGADDYLVKPFALAELLARVRSLTRRGPLERPTVLQVGDLTLDPASRAVQRGRVEVDLSPKEFALLHELRVRRWVERGRGLHPLPPAEGRSPLRPRDHPHGPRRRLPARPRALNTDPGGSNAGRRTLPKERRCGR